jgi:hypothetical protein
MLRFTISLVAGAFFSTASAIAQTPVELARHAIDTGDFAALETLLADQTESAHETRDLSALRGLFGTLFETANSARLEREEAWLAAYPDSAYAASALGWSHMHLAVLARGTASTRFTSGEAFAAHREELSVSLAMTDRALKGDPDFVPALDLAIVLAMYGAGQSAVSSLVERTLSVAPDPHALVLGLTALSPRWGGSVGQQFALCDTAKDKLPGFHDDICLIYVTFSEGLDGEMRQKALAALEKRDESLLDFARADAYRHEWRGRPGAAEKSMQFLMQRIGPGAGFDALESDLRLIAHTFRDPFFEIDAEDAIVAALRETLRDSPEDYRVLGRLLAGIFDNSRPDVALEQADEARALWRAMLVRGRYNPEVWASGERLERYLGSWTKPALTGPYAVNEIYYSNHGSNPLRQYVIDLFRLHEMARRPETLPAGTTLDDLGDDVLLCPMFRAQRLFAAICERSSRERGCSSAGADANVPDEVRRLMSRTEACRWERTAPVAELRFQPVSVSHFLGDDK